MSTYGLIAWISSVLSIIAYFFNIKKNKVCFLIWEISTILIVYNFIFGKPDKTVYWATAFLFAFYGIMNIAGYLQWRKEDRHG